MFSSCTLGKHWYKIMSVGDKTKLFVTYVQRGTAHPLGHLSLREEPHSEEQRSSQVEELFVRGESDRRGVQRSSLQ